MKITQISSLEKVRNKDDVKNEVQQVSLFLGEHYSYQIVLEAEGCSVTEIEVNSQLSDYINIYSVENSVMDLPVSPENCDDDYITKEPGLMPDLLIPINKQNNKQMFAAGRKVFWVEVCVPESFDSGEYDIEVVFKTKPTLSKDEPQVMQSVMKINVIGEVLPKQELLYTQWIHVDCIASIHNVEIYSERHWSLIETYIKTAVELGVNMIFTPVITPPLDTEVNTARPNTQLVKIIKTDDKYSFDFSLLHRWISVCRRNGIEHFEISHLFSQWGASFAPNIYVYENGVLVHEFGWHVDSEDERYVSFLKQFLPELLCFLKAEGVEKNTYFHLSDEPTDEQLEKYTAVYELVKPLIGECKLMDALSHYEFYEKGLVKNPVCATDHIEPFIENNAENLWAYYCVAQENKVANRFMALASYRNRISGIQLYKYNIKGFLHWGFNFYYSQLSRYEINPYITSSAGGAFVSGDSFSVYPTNGKPDKSLRAIVFYEALQDILICRMLEKRIGREAVIKLIDDEAKMNVTFSDYPRNSTYIPELISKMKKMIAQMEE